MIQLVMKAGEGRAELEVLRRFSRPDISSHPHNHVIPLLDELEVYDMVFAVLPLLEDNIVEPWFFDVEEALDAVQQTFEVSNMSRDVDFSKLIRNYLSGPSFHAFKFRCTQ